MRQCLALRARWVLPVASPAIENAVVSISRGRVVALGANVSAAKAIDLGDVVLLPGFVNAHTHLEFSDLASPLGYFGSPFAAWLRAVVRHRRAQLESRSPELLLAARRQALIDGMAELRRGGCVAVGEIATHPCDLTAYCCGDGPQPVVFLEALGLGDSQGILDQAERHFDACRTLDLRAGSAPHAPYTISLDDLQALASAAARRGLPVAFHLAETIEELELLSSHCGPLVEFLREMNAWRPDLIPRGIQPIDYLRALSKARRAVIIHGNFLGPAELVQCGQWRERLSVVYCPRTHARIAGGEYPLADMLRWGVMVAIGTDSRASNPDISMLSELRYLAATHQEVSPAVIVTLGTLNGARALGIERDFGSIEQGRRADLVAIPISGSAKQPEEALLDATAAATHVTQLLAPEARQRGGWVE